MSKVLDDLLVLLDLEPLEIDLFRGLSPPDSWQRVYGGQVIAQALVAATRTVEPDRAGHSLHGYFLRAGDPKVPILYHVDRIRDGRSFSTRRVVAVQHGQAIFSMAASFQIDEAGFDHHDVMPDVAPPDGLRNETELLRAMPGDLPEPMSHWLDRERPIELRPVRQHTWLMPGRAEPFQNIWMRSAGALPDDPALHRAILAYASDMSLLSTSALPHSVDRSEQSIQVASIDHALWFHRPFRMDEWLLYDQESPNASGGRGFNRGLIFDRAGTLVASVSQEGLIRPRKGPPPDTSTPPAAKEHR